MKKLALTSLIIASSLLASCGKTTIIREVSTPTSAAVAEEAPSSGLSSMSKVFIELRDSTPSLNIYTDQELYALMTTVCDKIDTWAPNYRGYLLNMKEVATGESTLLRAELAVLTMAAVNYVCTWHNAGFTAALNAETRN